MSQALLLDCDGVLADTERDGHRVAFNSMFDRLGVPLHWDEATYSDLVRTGGGKERLERALTPEVARTIGLDDADPDQRSETIRRWHRVKSRIFQDLVGAGAVPSRPGVARLVDSALAEGWRVAVASTSAVDSVRAVLERVVGPRTARGVEVFAGDVVARKKPAPDIYLHALEGLGCTPQEAVVIEDSAVGCAAARAASLPVIVTVSAFTTDEDFTGASLVLSELGEPGAPADVLADPLSIAAAPQVVVDIPVLRAVMARGVRA